MSFDISVFRLFISLILVLLFISIMNEPAEAIVIRNRYGNLLKWGSDWQPPRAEVRANLENELSPNIRSNLQGICYDILEKEEKPFYLYLGIGFRLNSLMLEPALGYSVRDREWLGALRCYISRPAFRVYSDWEFQTETKSFYYLTQLFWRFNAFFECGPEVEGWGDTDARIISQGLGLATALNFRFKRQRYHSQYAKFRLETSVQYRELGGLWKPQLIVRFILIPFIE